MNLEPQWWHHPKYWFKSPVDGMEEPDLEKIVAEATRRGEMKALTELAQKVSAMTMKDPGGLSESAMHEDYFDNGHTVGVNMACMLVIKEIDTKLTSLKKV